MHDQRSALAARAQEGDELALDRRRFAPSLQRNRQQTCRLVDNDKHVVFEDNLGLVPPSAPSTRRPPRSVERCSSCQRSRTETVDSSATARTPASENSAI